ncbi:polysaccharide biosynthesis tyrosine autokinase [Cohnella endophytica]|uniref:non-specific protein-tyrosine kinase n=1 Tax=Cohnella endophytica TaxID=2419778 RepID=A0A494Y036_9BACL|nr:CpsD/CapB family tyrosine-protein kinase [Cohnella endophytica]RKP53183.1 polysaccharide biosynthesis tyrosine autokinase [Cohnella endophytica]
MPAATKNHKIIAHENPRSPISESYKMLRTNIQFTSPDKPVHSILITSPEPGAGKSTTSVNLAVTFAQEGKKVVIVDADMRNPTQHFYFAKSNRSGLSNTLAGQMPLQQCLLDTYIENLTLLPSGVIPPNPAEMLSSNRMNQLMADLKEQFDIIIVDSPPVLAVTDAQVLATKCDGVLCVLNAGKVKRQVAQKTLKRLEYVNATILGVVLNKIQYKKSDALYSYYYTNHKNS